MMGNFDLTVFKLLSDEIHLFMSVRKHTVTCSHLCRRLSPALIFCATSINIKKLIDETYFESENTQNAAKKLSIRFWCLKLIRLTFF